MQRLSFWDLGETYGNITTQLAAAEKIVPVNQHATEMPLDGDEQRSAKEPCAEPLAACAAPFLPLGKERRAGRPSGRYRTGPAVEKEHRAPSLPRI